jgi:S1-C subfamily serine protease
LPEGFDYEGLPGANCAEPHDSEVVKIGVVPSSSYPLSEQVMEEISTLCVQGFEEYTGLIYGSEPNLSVSAYTPSKREWDNDHRLFVCVAWLLDGQQLTSSLSANSGSTNSASGNLTVREVYELAIPSVVTVECGYSQGTGFAYDVDPADGFQSVIVTNHHVIADCTFEGGPDVIIYTQDNTTPRAMLWNWDEENDLATIMIELRLPVLLDGPEGAIGDQVVAVGSPLGFSGTITTGIISQIYEDAYQTDAAVNPGNSGGPLLDMRGRLLGVTTLGFGREGLNIAFRQALLCEQLVLCS